MTQTIPPPAGLAAPDVAVVRAPTEIDLATAPALRAALRECIDAGYRHIQVDLAGVTFMDCTAISAVLAARRAAAASGSSVVVVRPTPAAHRVLRIAGMTMLLQSEPPEGAPRLDRDTAC